MGGFRLERGLAGWHCGGMRSETDQTVRNWAGNHTYSAGRWVRATSLAQAQQVVAESSRVRALGTRHSFNALCDTEGTLLDLTGLPDVAEVDAARSSVRVTGGTTYGELARLLEEQGLALANMGSLPHISVAGAAATGTHGSGAGNQILGASVARLELITHDGSLRVLSRGEAGFAGAVVSLGALGIVTHAHLDVRPTFQLTQEVYDHLSWTAVVTDVNAILDSAYSVSIFTRWRDETTTEVLVKREVPADRAPAWTGGTAPVAPRAPFVLLGDDDKLTPRGVPGPWLDRLPHFRADRSPSWGEEIQTEWFIDREDATAALRALTPVLEQFDDLLTVTEIRAVRADELWLSPAFGRDTVAVHFTWARQPAPVLQAAQAIQATLLPYAPRPHWGKVFDTETFDATARYPMLADFVELITSLDPTGTFRSPFVDRLLRLS